MSAPQAAENTNTEERREQAKEVQQTKKAENLNDNAEEQTKRVQTAVADPQITNEKPEDKKKSMGENLLGEANKITVNVNFNDKYQQMYDALSKGGDIFKRTEKTIWGGPSFSSGKIYFEVDVKGKKFWGVGVAEESAEKKGYIKVKPKNGFWMISRKKGKEKENTIKVYNDDSDDDHKDKPKDKDKDKDKANRGSLKQPQFDRVRVLVDFDEGVVAFYNADTSALIYTFRDSFPKLRPVIL